MHQAVTELIVLRARPHTSVKRKPILQRGDKEYEYFFLCVYSNKERKEDKEEE
jgi:hypothetical protein